MISEFWPQGEREREREGEGEALHLSVKVAAMTCRLFMAKYNRRTPLADLVVSLSPCQLIILSRFLLPLVFALMFLPPPLALPLTLPLVGVAWLFQLSHTFLFLSAFRNCLKTNKLTRDSSDHPPLSLTRVFPFLFFWGYPNQRLIKFIYLSLIFIIKKEQNKQIQQHDVSPTNRFKWGFCPSSINQKTLQIHDKCFIQSM